MNHPLEHIHLKKYNETSFTDAAYYYPAPNTLQGYSLISKGPSHAHPQISAGLFKGWMEISWQPQMFALQSWVAAFCCPWYSSLLMFPAGGQKLTLALSFCFANAKQLKVRSCRAAQGCCCSLFPIPFSWLPSSASQNKIENEQTNRDWTSLLNWLCTYWAWTIWWSSQRRMLYGKGSRK